MLKGGYAFRIVDTSQRILDRDLLIRLLSQPIHFSPQFLPYSKILNEEVDRRRQRWARHIFTRRYI